MRQFSNPLPISHLQSLISHPFVAKVSEIARARNVPVPVALVGGTLRDALLSPDSMPHDLDFAVRGDAIALARGVADALSADFYVMDAERGTARVLVRSGEDLPLIMDFAICRGAGWQDDLFARDFTINAIALDLGSGEVLDPTNGLSDLQRGIIRAASDHAIAEDPVRALRAVRLASALKMRIEPATLEMVRGTGARIRLPSAERVRDEFMEILNLAVAAGALRQLDEVGLLTHIAPEIEPMRTCEQSPPHHFTALEHTFVVLEALDRMMGDGLLVDQDDSSTHNPQPISSSHRKSLVSSLRSHTTESRTRAAVFRFAVLLHDCAKPFTRSVGEDGKIHFYGHEAVGAELAAARGRGLRLSGDEMRQVRVMVENHMRPNQMARQMARDSRPPTPRALYHFFRDTGDCAPELALFAIADCLGKRGDHTASEDCAPSVQIANLLIEKYYTQFEKTVVPAPLLTGRDVIALGVKQGPHIGEILGAVREAQMTGEISSREEALALVISLRPS